ncbi:MAG: hypothetical protein PHW63_05795 [Alphaproteobacteria bacterium]|nr:hypothetical protein [Alphaproteobacteria bacterium]
MFETTKDSGPHSNHLVDEVKKMGRNFKADATDAAHAAKNDLEGVARDAGSHVRTLVDSAQHSLKDASGTVAVKIRENPIQSTLIALGVGLLAGIIYRR